MDFQLTEDHRLVRETARSFAQEVLARDVAERDEKEIFPEEAVKQLGELGFLGIMVPEAWGGAGMDALSYVLIVEELAKVDASVAAIVSVQNSLVNEILLKFGTPAQKEAYLKPLASGKFLGAFALSEPQAGSDPASLTTTAQKDGSYYVLNGTKNFITTGSHADVLMVFATLNRSKGYKGICAFIVEKGTPGFQVTKREKKMGLRSSDTCELSFEDCRIPRESLVGEEGRGLRIALTALDGGRIGIAAQALGIAEASFEAALRYAQQRRQFGRPILEFQAIQFKLATMATEIEASRLLTYRAAMRKDGGEDYVLDASMAKLKASEVAVHCSREALQIFGGYGYTRDFPVERYFRDAKITEIYEGTSEIQRLVIAREILKREGRIFE